MNEDGKQSGVKPYCPPLWAVLLMDAIGMASMFVPMLGSWVDSVWAVVSAFVFYYWFRTPIAAIAAFTEEFLPITDVIPTFTIAYIVTQLKDKRKR